MIFNGPENSRMATTRDNGSLGEKHQKTFTARTLLPSSLSLLVLTFVQWISIYT